MSGTKGQVSGLTCPVCYNSYKTNGENNIPRSLNCGHTYCTGCLEKLMSERNDTVIIRCPTCKRETVLLALDCTHSLPKNFGLLEIVSMYENDNVHVESRENSSLIDKPVCNEHDEHMKVYCHTDNCLICIYCQVYGEHAGHDCEMICELVKAKKESIADAYSHCIQSIKRLMKEKTSNDESFTQIRQKENALDEKIRGHFENLHSELDKREQCLKKRMHTKIREQAMALLTQERMLCELIRKGNELRKRCSQLLKSSDYSILVTDHETTICDLVNELLDLTSNYDSVPTQLSQLSWEFEGELIDVVKLHGKIVEKSDPSSNERLANNDDQDNDQSHDDVVETLNRMFDTASSEEDIIALNIAQTGLEAQNDKAVDEREVKLEEHIDVEEELDDHETEEGAVGLFINLAHDNSSLINELRIEMRREIQRLKDISVPVSVEYQVLSDSSSENGDKEGEPGTDAEEQRLQRFGELRLQLPEGQSNMQEKQDEEQHEEHYQQVQQDQAVHEHHHHHLREQHKRHLQALQMKSKSPRDPRVNKHHNGNTRDMCCGLCSPPNKCHRLQSASNTHSHHIHPFTGSHVSSGRHYHHSSSSNCREAQSSKIKSGHVRKCQMCHMVKDNKNHDVCSKCHASNFAETVVASSKIICPMCTLANEAGKSTCELCGFDLTR